MHMYELQTIANISMHSVNNIRIGSTYFQGEQGKAKTLEKVLMFYHLKTRHYASTSS